MKNVGNAHLVDRLFDRAEILQAKEYLVAPSSVKDRFNLTVISSRVVGQSGRVFSRVERASVGLRTVLPVIRR